MVLTEYNSDLTLQRQEIVCQADSANDTIEFESETFTSIGFKWRLVNHCFITS